MYDSWRTQQSAHAMLRAPWCGHTILVDRDCPCIDAAIEHMCAIYDHALPDATDHPMTPFRTVKFNDDRTTHEIEPYSEHYEEHPHFRIAAAGGWKKMPPRADVFTGKSAQVMKTRRLSISKALRPVSARKRRRQIMNSANSALGIPLTNSGSLSMDVDSAGAALQSNMEIDTDGTTITGMDIDYNDMVAAISLSPISAAQERT